MAKRNKGSWYERHKAKMAGVAAGLRRAILDFLGGKCIECGCSDERVLQVHHVDGNGRQHRQDRGTGTMYLRDMIKQLGQGIRYMLLCANCHRILHYEMRRAA